MGLWGRWDRLLQYLTEVSAIFKISLHTASYAGAEAGVAGGAVVRQKGARERQSQGWR